MNAEEENVHGEVVYIDLKALAKCSTCGGFVWMLDCKCPQPVKRKIVTREQLRKNWRIR